MNELVQFESSDIRRIWDDESEQWFFAVVDVIEVLTDSKNPANYWKAMKARRWDLPAPHLILSWWRLWTAAI